jgi:nicotine blue oxidoreductase
VTGLVLAAGAGRRLGRPKAEVVLGGRRLVDRSVEVLLAGGCHDVLVVVRDPALVVPSARTVYNVNPDEGMGSSLRVGLSAVGSAACLIVLVDQPDITAAEVSAVLRAFEAGARLVVARRSGRRSHPVLVTQELFGEFAGASSGDQGARAFLDARPEAITYVDLADELPDIDSVEDLRAAEQRLPAS